MSMNLPGWVDVCIRTWKLLAWKYEVWEEHVSEK